jgi:hypothetical protein
MNNDHFLEAQVALRAVFFWEQRGWTREACLAGDARVAWWLSLFVQYCHDNHNNHDKGPYMKQQIWP